jgi:CubicO group peptidase (beta-lactamase class C family)
MRQTVIVLAQILVLATSVFAQPPAQSYETKVDQIFAQWDKPGSPGCALGVIKDGRIIYERAYGTGNLELDTPIKTSSVFHVGSISKQFTALSILMLAQQGKLSLDDDVRKHIPEVPDFGAPITLRHLIHHTSGLRDFLEMLEMAGWRVGDIATEKDVLSMVSRQRTLNHKPGDEFVYTNTGYLLLAIVVNRVARQSLRDFAAENIFKPLGMTNTRFADDHTLIILGLVDGYLPKAGGGFKKWMPADDHIGSSNLVTTIADLARWDLNFYEKRVGGALIDQMLTPGVLNEGTKLDYAFALYSLTYKGLPTVVHAGSTLGYQGTLIRFPHQRFSVAVLCNVRGNNPDALSRRVADIYLADQFKPAAANTGAAPALPENPIKLSSEALSRWAGVYWSPANDLVRSVNVKEGKLIYSRIPGNESELVPLDESHFLMAGVRNRVEITFKASGTRKQMIFLETGGKPLIFEAVATPAYSPKQLAEFGGRYICPELDTTYMLTPKENQLLFQTGNWGDFLLSPRFADSFANPPEMGSLIFTRDARKRVSGFVVRSGKVRNLRCDKMRP